MSEIKQQSKFNSGHLKQFWTLVVKYLKVNFREKENLFWIFGYPLLFMVLFLIAFNSGGARSTYNIVIINNDVLGLDSPETDMGANTSLILLDLFDQNSNFSETFSLQKSYSNGTEITESGARQLVEEEKIDGLIIIPQNFSEIIIGSTWWYPLVKQGIIPPNTSDEFMTLMLSLNETDYISGSPQLEIYTIADAVTGQVISSVFNSIVNDIILGYNNISSLSIEQSIGPEGRELTWFDMAAPGLVAVGVLVGISNLSTMFAFEKSKGLLQRLDTTPVPRSILLLSGGVGQLAISSIQITILLGMLPIFGVNVSPDANWFLAFIIALSLAFTCIGLGLILASFVKSASTAGGLSWIIILPLQFLGGGFFPLESDITKFIPTFYTIRAIRLVMIYGAPLSLVWQDILITLGFGFVFTCIGMIIFTKKRKI
jgi:ABC-type multidrug transport system permease subunit